MQGDFHFSGQDISPVHWILVTKQSRHSCNDRVWQETREEVATVGQYLNVLDTHPEIPCRPKESAHTLVSTLHQVISSPAAYG